MEWVGIVDGVVGQQGGALFVEVQLDVYICADIIYYFFERKVCYYGKFLLKEAEGSCFYVLGRESVFLI